MESERTGSDLEDGEIREDDFEDISDGSLSDVIPEGNTLHDAHSFYLRPMCCFDSLITRIVDVETFMLIPCNFRL